METRIALLQKKEIRKILHQNQWCFVVVDAVAVLTDSANPTDSLNKVRRREPELVKGYGQIVHPLPIDIAGGIQKLRATTILPNLRRALRTRARAAQPSMNPAPTERQGQFLAYIHQYSVINGCAPAEADMRRFFQISAPSAHSMMLNLERRGFIQRVPGQARSIILMVPPESPPPLRRARLNPPSR